MTLPRLHQAEHETTSPAPAPHSRRRVWDQGWFAPSLLVVLSLAAAGQALQIWRWRPGVPLSLSGDAPQVLLQIRTVLDHSWYGTNPSVGAPFGMNVSWFTTGDALNFLCIQFIGLFSDSPATVGAVFFIAQFPLAGLTAYWLARELRMIRPAAMTVGVLFAVLPGHQQWFSHVWLSAYWMIPLAVWLVLEVANGRRLWPRPDTLRASGSEGRAARLCATRTAAIVAAIGLADVYYVAFTLILLVLAVMLRLARGPRPVRLVPEVLTTTTVGLLCGVTLFIATGGRGAELVTGTLPAQRGIGESETYAGKLIELALPWYEHRAEPLRFLAHAYAVAAPPSVERPALGVVALFGVVVLLWTALRSLAGGRRAAALPGLLAALTLVCLAFYTRGGLGSLVALFVTPQIRTWSRFVVFLGLFGLLAVGLWLSGHGRPRGRRWAWPAAALVCLLGVLDQTSPGAAPEYGALRAEKAELTAFARELHRAVGDCAIFQLPVVAYPEETPPGSMGDYDHLLPSTMSPGGLTWSYGAIRGTARADWQFALPLDRPRQLLQDLADAGFCAVEVDRDGYAGAADPTSTIAAALGEPAASAPSEHLLAYDLTRIIANPSRRDSVLRPLFASAAGSLIDASGRTPYQWTGPTTQITVANMGTGPEVAVLSFRVRSNQVANRSIDISVPGQEVRRLSAGPDQDEPVSVRMTVEPGTTTVHVSASGATKGVPGTEGRSVAALRLSDLRLASSGGVNAASLQEFAALSPRSLR